MPTRIVTYAHRSKRPPQKRKAVALAGSAVVRKRAAKSATPPAAKDDGKSAVVTVRRKSRFGDVPDLSPEELKRRADAAVALWRELVRRSTGIEQDAST